MGRTYAESFINARIVSRKNLFFLERIPDKAKDLSHLSHNPLHTEPSSFIRKLDLIVLSVKPQDFPDLSNKLMLYLRKDQVVLSIMAGVTVESIQRELGVKKVVRAMPNLPARLGLGMSVFTASKEVNREEILNVQNLLNTTGKTLYTSEENMIDAATAISGSGPAYVFYFMDAMIEVAQNLGFTEAQADLLVKQTFLGSINLLNRNDLSCKEWISKVASRGGTTEAALKSFDKGGFFSHLTGGLNAAHNRATELSELLNS